MRTVAAAAAISPRPAAPGVTRPTAAPTRAAPAPAAATARRLGSGQLAAGFQSRSAGTATGRRARAAPAAAAAAAPAAGGGGGDTPPRPPARSTETVNDTVDEVDQAALGGDPRRTGVTGVTEGVVNGVAGPESTVGKVVDETVGAVGGLLGGGKR